LFPSEINDEKYVEKLAD